MKKVITSLSFLAVMLCFTSAFAQFKSTVDPQPSVSQSMVKQDDGSFLLGLIDPNNFSMRHSFSLSYMTFGGQGMSLGTYTNSMMYKFSDALDIETDISLMTSQFNSFGKQAQSSFNGLFLNRAELNYRPWKNTLFQVSYRQLPANYWMSPGYGYSGFGGFFGLDRSLDNTH